MLWPITAIPIIGTKQLFQQALQHTLFSSIHGEYISRQLFKTEQLYCILPRLLCHLLKRHTFIQPMYNPSDTANSRRLVSTFDRFTQNKLFGFGSRWEVFLAEGLSEQRFFRKDFLVRRANATHGSVSRCAFEACVPVMEHHGASIEKRSGYYKSIMLDAEHACL